MWQLIVLENKRLKQWGIIQGELCALPLDREAAGPLQPASMKGKEFPIGRWGIPVMLLFEDDGHTKYPTANGKVFCFHGRTSCARRSLLSLVATPFKQKTFPLATHRPSQFGVKYSGYGHLKTNSLLLLF